MTLVVDQNGRIIDVPTAPVAPGRAPSPEQAYSRGMQTTPPSYLASDIPTAGVETWPLQPLQLSPGVAPATAPARTASDLAPLNQQAELAVRAMRPEAPIYQQAQRGNYNMYNTDPSKLAKPVGAGLNFGFGVNGQPTATQYLQNAAVQDRLAAADRQQAALLRDYTAAQASIGPNSTIGEIGAARQRMAALAPILGVQTQNQGAATGALIGAQASAQDAATRLQAAQLASNADIAGRLLTADLTGRYGLAAATTKAGAAQQKIAAEAASPAGRKAAAEAALLETQLNAVAAGVQAGQLNANQVIAATRSGQERQFAPATDPLTGVPYTPEEQLLIQRRRMAELQQQTQQ